MIKTIAYLRLSTTEDKQRNAYAVQLADIERAIGKPDQVVQEGVSGAADLDKRPALLALIESLKPGDRVIVQRYDRLARDMVRSGWIRYEILKRGAELISATEPEQDEAGKLLQNILLSIAEHEKALIRGRIKKTFEQKRKRGEKLGGFVPYGFRLEGDRLAPCPDETRTIEEIKRLNKKRLSAYKIAATLNDRGVRSKLGRRWSPAAIKKILKRV